MARRQHPQPQVYGSPRPRRLGAAASATTPCAVFFFLTAWAAITLAFLLFRLMPGDPVSIMLAQAFAGPGQKPGRRSAADRRQLSGHVRAGPAHLCPVRLLPGNVLSGFNFGPSFVAFDAGADPDFSPVAVDHRFVHHLDAAGRASAPRSAPPLAGCAAPAWRAWLPGRPDAAARLRRFISWPWP